MRNLILNNAPAVMPWLQPILNSVTQAVLITDADFLVLQWNARSEQLLDQKAGSLAGKNLIDLMHEFCCDTCGISRRLQQVAEKGMVDEDILLIRPDGEILKLSCYAYKLPGTEQLSVIVAMIHEPQGQNDAGRPKEKVDESIFYSFLDNSLAPAWIADEDGYVLFMNKIALHIWHLDETYRFKRAHELFPKQIADGVLASDRMVLETGQPIAFVVPSIRKDGTPGFYMLHKFLLPLNTAKRLVVGQAIDLTEEIHMREELRKSNERFSYVAKAVSDCIWDWNMETGQIYRSEALMILTGYAPGDIEESLDWWVGKVHPTDRRGMKNKLDAFIKQGHPYCDVEYRFRCADGRYKYFSDKGYIIYSDGKPVRAIGVVHDITEKKKLEAKLLQQKIQKQKDISQAIMATQDHVCNELGKELHDNVNQILASASMMLTYARNKDCENSGDCFDKCGHYLQLAIGEIRKISKSLNTSIIGEMGLIKPVEEIVANMKLARSITVQFKCEPVLEQQLSGEQKLMIYRIIQEQTNNIMKYAEAGKVWVLIKRKANSLSLVIQDDGKGVDLKNAKRGIGLANIKNRVEAFSGSFGIVSSPGKGCRIEISVPLKRT
ncbi:PAS domain-containing sensor histidine kinase [Niastella populi]|uniref:histidine kinase n=1 Tax=Niastella populi TaxID=550983 RepID=A0A1V9EJU7_9BACT|nr:PAS domain-containing protein [Niastella populi]OQP46417.1 hypothetical protein A4R26_31960 [Niastella populi]